LVTTTLKSPLIHPLKEVYLRMKVQQEKEAYLGMEV